MNNVIVLKDLDPDSPLTSAVLYNYIQSKSHVVPTMLVGEYPPKITSGLIRAHTINELKRLCKYVPVSTRTIS